MTVYSRPRRKKNPDQMVRGFLYFFFLFVRSPALIGEISLSLLNDGDSDGCGFAKTAAGSRYNDAVGTDGDLFADYDRHGGRG